MKKRKGWSFPKTREGKLNAEFLRLMPVLNEVFMRDPRLYHNLPELGELIAGAWRGFASLGMKLDGKVGITEILYPVTRGDHARIYAFLLFWWKVASIENHAEIIKRVQAVERKLKAEGREFKETTPTEGKVDL